jgi:TonB family protein
LPAQEDTSATLLSRGAVTILLRSDTTYGLYLWVSAQVAAGRRGEPRLFRARFRPEAALAWADEAVLVLAPTRVLPSDGPELRTAALEDLYENRVIVARRRQGSRWSREVYLSFWPTGAESLTFRVQRSQAEEFFETLSARARAARLSREDDTDYRYRRGKLNDTLTKVTRLSSPQLDYPAPMVRVGLPGMVLMHVVIDSTGRTDPDLSRVVFSTHPEFSRAARALIAGTRYTPPTRDGQVITAEVCQPVHFAIYR